MSKRRPGTGRRRGIAFCGSQRLPEREVEQRDRYYHTRFHTTHLNAARFRDEAERFLLVLLWRQGCLIEIDTWGDGLPRTVLDGLCRPHSIRPTGDSGWMIANSQGQRLWFWIGIYRWRDGFPAWTAGFRTRCRPRMVPGSSRM